ncbi:MAG: D-alanyl-D-alanine carboxypeptidase family protein [Oscillospiraceae bacterium]|nr:D-alanyl-D-alanine carboxypeptidase family protein [Oscillospiraceae bacterium]
MAKNTKKKAATGKRSGSSAAMLLLVLMCMAGLVMGVYLIANGGGNNKNHYYNITMEVGQSRTLVTTFPGDFTCAVSDDALLSVDETHLMTALAPGDVVVIAEGAAGDRETFYIQIVGGTGTSATTTSSDATTTTTTTSEATTTTTTVSLGPGSVTGIELTFYAVSLKVGENKMPIVTMSPADATDKSEQWTSSDESVATVNWLGDITAVGPGVCIVRVTSVNNPSVYAEVTVTVMDETPSAPAANVEVINGVTYVQGILIVNKTYALPADYDPGVNPEAKAAFDRMQVAASAEMMSLSIVSGYRSYATQEATYNRHVVRSGQEKADTFSARPGHSEHQTGLAFDINYAGDSFGSTPEAAWLAANCWKYGFIIRYPQGKSDITGYKYEPWHIRYLGEENAKKVYDSGLTLEEYLGITSQYAE